MCNIAENIIVKRVAHIINSIATQEDNEYKKHFTYYGGKEQAYFTSTANALDDLDIQTAFNLSRRLEDVFSLIFAGANVKRFVVVNTENTSIKAMPIVLLEVFDPSHAFVPIFIGKESILLVSPFPNETLSVRVSDNPYICELIPTSLLTNVELNATNVNLLLTKPMGIYGMTSELLGYTSDTSYVEMDLIEDTSRPGLAQNNQLHIGDFIFHVVSTFASGIAKQDQVLSRSLAQESSGKLIELTKDSKIYTKIKRLYGTEDIDRVESNNSDPIICTTDYMPIYLTYKKDESEVHGFAVLSENEDSDGNKKTVVSINGSMLGLGGDRNKISAILTKDNTKFGMNYVVDLGDFYYVGDNKVILLTPDMTMSDPVNLFDEFAIPDNTPLTRLDEEIGTEAFDGLKKVFGMTGDALKGFWFVVRRFGIKQGSNFFILLGRLFSQIKGGVKWLVNTFMSTFKRGIDLEKAEALELQEKILNDELDEMTERFRMYGQVYFRSVALSIATGGFFAFPMVWLFSKARTKKAKVKAIERIERRIDDAIERLERKMNYAEERSENESVDSILREIQLYRAAKQKVLDFKRDSLRTDRIKYVTYDKDLGLTPEQRVEQHINNSGTY